MNRDKFAEEIRKARQRATARRAARELVLEIMREAGWKVGVPRFAKEPIREG